jgi:hypothetical protein
VYCLPPFKNNISLLDGFNEITELHATPNNKTNCASKRGPFDTNPATTQPIHASQPLGLKNDKFWVKRYFIHNKFTYKNSYGHFRAFHFAFFLSLLN